MGSAPGSRYDMFFRSHKLRTPCLMIDLDVVTGQFRRLSEELPDAEIFYAVKANPHPAVIRVLGGLGSSFDVASSAEVDLCLGEGTAPGRISYGNTIKRSADIRYAYEKGIRLYAFDSEDELRKIARLAPGSAAFCRILVNGDGAQWPLSGKFGCAPEMAVDLLALARRLGLGPLGVSFHVGSQQLDPGRWASAIKLAAELARQLGRQGVDVRIVNLGGGLPASYGPEVPPIGDYASVIGASLRRHGIESVRVIVEPGRYLVADAGLLRSSVVLVSRKTYRDLRRWVYLDIGRFGGLAETENEAIRYPLATTKDGWGESGPVTLAGPTCDGQDVLYEKTPGSLSTCLEEGDFVDFLSAGAYTASYSSVGFNGFPPLPTYCFGGDL